MNFHGSEFNLKLEKTMKKYFVYIASAVLMMAACAKEEVNTPVETPVVGETEFISIELNPATRTILDGTNTNWSAGDAVGVYFRNESIGTLTLVEGSTNKFEGEIESALLLGQDKVTLKYPADVTAVPTTQVAVAGSFANGAALLEGETTIEDLRAGNGTELQNKTALLKFTVAKAGDVTFEVGSTKYTVTGCKTGNTYYACVASASNVSFVARIGGYLSKKASSNKTFTVGKIADLGVLPAPETSTYKLMGVGGDWSTGLVFYKDVDNSLLLKNVTLTSSTGFKFCQESAWGRPITFEKGKWAFTYDFPNDNMTKVEGTFDIWASTSNDAVCFVDKDAEKPAFTNENKLIHILYEETGNCGLYIQSPTTTVNNYNNSGAWGNYKAVVYMKKNASDNQNYCAFPLPSNVVGKSCKFTIRVWGDKNKTYTKTMTEDTPFWGNSDNGNSYSLSSKINIK